MMTKPSLILFIVITVLLLIIPEVSSLDVNIDQPSQAAKLRYIPVEYNNTDAESPDLYFFSRDLKHATGEPDTRHTTSVSPDDTIMSYIAIRNTPHHIVNSLSHTFSLHQRGQHSSFKVQMPSTPGDLLMIGAAFLTNMVVHEVGHEVVAQHVGASGSKLDFFQTRNGQFFLGTSTVEDITDDSILPYTMGGEFFADLMFEHALQDYRKKPNLYNQSLLLYSGIDFAFYCFYAFYASEDHPEYDPVTISKETGLSRDHLFSIVLAKTMINAYRVYTGEDRVIPYFTVDKHSAMLNLAFPFEIPSCVFGNCGISDEEI